MKSHLIFCILLYTISTAICILLAPLAADAQPEPQERETVELTPAERIMGLSLIWQEVNYNFAFFDQVPELNWDSVYVASIPKILEAQSAWDYYRELQRIVALLNDGHTGVWMPPSLRDEIHERDTYPWVLTHRVERRILVRAAGRSLIERIPLHSEIIGIDGRPALNVAHERLPYIAQSTEHVRLDHAIREALHGPAAEPVTIRYITPEGETRTIKLERDRRTREDEWIPDVNAPVPPFEFRWLDNGIAYTALNTFADTMAAYQFEQMLPEIQNARALIIDIRRNGGGNSGIGYRVASWLTNDTLETSRWRTREHRAAFRAWGVDDYAAMDAWYDGGTHGIVPPAEGDRIIVPTIVLLDHGTFSAAEDFLVAVDPIPHFTTMGRPSGGSTGQPLFFELPGDGGARVVTKRDTYPDGRDFVGIGVIPDITIEQTVDDIRSDRDAQLEAAIMQLRE